jgi:hypothetical protein
MIRKRESRFPEKIMFHSNGARRRLGSGAPFHFDRRPSRSRAGLADDPFAALADAAGAAAPHAGFLGDSGGARLSARGPFSEFHSNGLRF